MPLASGTRLGPYEIAAPLGAGGMGEVYRARDSRLARTVALKVLSADLRERPDERAGLIARFEREARAVAALNHPHICVLYDIGQDRGIDFLVMEYLEGETLAERLTRGALPLDQMLPFAIQIADAIEQAHRQGVVHRDLKPGNIMVTKKGAKLLDFGLAKTVPVFKPASGETATLTRALSADGAILGTLQYMPPEQLEGKDADARSDIFAFGAVLYEMATGTRAFEASSQASLIAAILERDPPPLSQRMPLAPPALERAVRLCLAKDPNERWQNAGDLKRELQWIAEEKVPEAGAVAPSRTAPNRAWLPWAAMAAVMCVAAVSWWLFRANSKPGIQDTMRVSVAGIEKLSTPGEPIISPDGRRLVFEVGKGGKTQLYIRALNSMTTQPLPGTDGAQAFWSPDGRSIGLVFPNEQKIKRIELSGGEPHTICEVSAGRPNWGGTWSPDGVILFTVTGRGVYRVPAGGGTPAQVTSIDETAGETQHKYPYFLPDGQHFLYVAPNRQRENSAIYTGRLDSPLKKRILSAASRPEYALPGYLLFVKENTLFAQPFDARQLRVSGESSPIADHVVQSTSNANTLFSASQTGVVVYSRLPVVDDQLVWLDRNGKQVGRFETATSGGLESLRLSPNDQRVISTVATTYDTLELWMGESARSMLSRFSIARDPRFPVWSADGNRIVYTLTAKGGAGEIWVRPVAGSGGEELLLHQDGQALFPQDWSADGRLLLYSVRTGAGRGLYVLPMFGDRRPSAYLNGAGDPMGARISPDGRWVTYQSKESGRNELYIQSFPEPGNKKQISLNGGHDGVWSRGGNEFFYRDATERFISVPVRLSPKLTFGTPRELFPLPKDVGFIEPTVDGQRFLATLPAGEPEPRRFVLVLNWQAQLAR